MTVSSDTHAQLRPSCAFGIWRNTRAMESVETGSGRVIVVEGDNADVASSVPPRGLLGSVTFRTEMRPPDVWESIVSVTDETVATCWNFTTMVTSAPSRN